jgi:hypothetical protein
MGKSVAPCLDVHEGHARDDEYTAEELGGAEALTQQRNGHRGGEQGYEVQEGRPSGGAYPPNPGVPAKESRNQGHDADVQQAKDD